MSDLALVVSEKFWPVGELHLAAEYLGCRTHIKATRISVEMFAASYEPHREGVGEAKTCRQRSLISSSLLHCSLIVGVGTRS